VKQPSSASPTAARRLRISGNDAGGAGGGIAVVFDSVVTIRDSLIQANTASVGGAIAQLDATGSLSVVNSCIVFNSDTAVIAPTGYALDAGGNWWGSAWGPLISGAPAGSGSLVSDGDSIAGDGVTSVLLPPPPPLDTGGEDSNPIPTGAWLTSAPLSGCFVCTAVSGSGAGRSCS
jgi:hypothetical protein